MWDASDHFDRWVQLLCAIPLLVLGVILEYYWWHSTTYRHGSYYGAGGTAMILLGLRCLWYALTGKNNVNRDDY